ncbi:MAG TPA: hypothetical protein VGE34_02890 [Candidatus Saccharimonadales bacterium]
MANKQKKKRNKVYRGKDAKIVQPQVIRVEAANRNKLHQWWFERKRIIKPVSIGAGIAVLLGWMVYELFRIIL